MITPISKPAWLASRLCWLLLIGLTLGLGSGWISYSRAWRAANQTTPYQAALTPAPVAGHPAPDFTLKTLTGETLRLSDLKGKPVLLNFWATWCGPCRAEFPDLQRAYVDNTDTLVIIGINNTVSDQPAAVADFVAEFGITFPILLDQTGEVAQTYRVLGLPTTVFIDRHGLVNELFTGPINQAYIEAKLTEL